MAKGMAVKDNDVVQRMSTAVLAMSSVIPRRLPPPSETLDGFLDFGRRLLKEGGSFRGRAFLFLFWGSDENLTQVVQIGDGNIKPTLVARSLVEDLRPDSFVLAWEAWYSTTHLEPGQAPPSSIATADDPHRKEALLVFYRSRTKKRLIRQMFHHDERGQVAFDELAEEDMVNADFRGLVADMEIPGVSAYQ